MRVRRGLTLIEMIVALVITGTVTLLAYGSIQAAIDTSNRLSEQRNTVESEAMVRTMLSDALRHPADSPDGAPAFAITSSVEAGGSTMQFVSRGVSGTQGAGGLWRVVVRSAAGGLEVEASSLDGSAATIKGRIKSISAVEARVLRAADDRAWQNHWESTQQFPTAVEITFRDLRGRVSGAQLIVQTGFGAS